MRVAKDDEEIAYGDECGGAAANPLYPLARKIR